MRLSLRRSSTALAALVLFCIVGAYLRANWPAVLEAGGAVTKFRHDATAVPCRDVHVVSCSEQPLHVGMIALGDQAPSELYRVLKDVVARRSCPLVLHVVCDPTTCEAVAALKQTWPLAGVEWHAHPADAGQARVAWIPTLHKAGWVAHLKLVYPQLLPQVAQLVVIDLDLLVQADLCQLAGILADHPKALFAAVPQQSDWYLGTLPDTRENVVWPAIERGLNTGVMVLHLERMRAWGWDQRWQSLVRRELLVRHHTGLADQDVYNLVALEHPETWTMLSCAWNVQLHDHSVTQHCDQPSHLLANARVLHWNSPKKYDAAFAEATYVRSLLAAAEAHSGLAASAQFTLRCPGYDAGGSSLSLAWAAVDTSWAGEDPAARADIVEGGHLDENNPAATRAPGSRITLVTHLTPDRLAALQQTLHQWDGPVHAAVYLADADLWRLRQFLEQVATLEAINLTLHVAFEDGGRRYPVNHLRNLLLDHVTTSHVFMADVDLCPLAGSRAHLEQALSASATGSAQRVALVVPAFEYVGYRAPTFLSLTTVQDLDLADIRPFRVDVWPRGHGPTNYTRLQSASDYYQVSWAPGYEPYVVLRTATAPRYPEALAGFGWNKVVYASALHRQGFDFIVAATTALVHLPHGPSRDLASFRSDQTLHDCTWAIAETLDPSVAALRAELTQNEPADQAPAPPRADGPNNARAAQIERLARKRAQRRLGARM
ncbi:uncharacterized protein MONBRDRAFT_13344 [Monosiga brevicollis MX1]|uniref:Glycosyltransferase-like protein LARGE2 n=1 Tax=Monosiga brevicollis TaxID=81824 RepID=A9UQJ7_MONBE|nr:uncharacterized protein MONBRDRAFT_13344 [Monosiga brevicollis MX1]EDQ92611.1 predicted protein [Monosiga brevicollis MX1]|eukprot:XP_001742373.1 hypothetical protein [Monosiga brevicollis MX1]